MIYKHYERKEHLVYFLLIVAALVFVAKGYGATTLDQNIQSDGNVYLSGATSSLIFANNWKISQTVATTTELTVKDSGGSTVIVFDEN